MVTRPGFIDEETGEAFVIAKRTWPTAHAVEACDVVGDCLAPRIQNGDVVIIDQDDAWGPGAIIAFRGPNGHQIKQVVRHEAGELVLTSNDGEFTLRDDAVTVLGRVVSRLWTLPGLDEAEARHGI